MGGPLHRLKRAAKLAYYVFRSAISGEYVSKDYAAKHPDTTVRERRHR